MWPKKSTYRYCVVPQCNNTTIRTPNKLFFSIPTGEQKRKDWCTAMGRTRILRPNTNCFCCEDHFDIEKDMENYMKWKLYGVTKLILKKGIMPHKFACQNYVSITETHKEQLGSSSLHIKEEVSDSDSGTLSCNSDTLSCDSDVEARLRDIYDIHFKKEIVFEPLPEIEHTENKDPLAIEDTINTPKRPHIVNIIYVEKVEKKTHKNVLSKR